MMDFGPAGWQIVRGNIVVFAFVCAITFVFGGLDPSALMMIG